MKKRDHMLIRLAWALNDVRRAALCAFLGGVAFLALLRATDLGYQVCFLCGWDAAVSVYLTLLGAIIFTADAHSTQQRVSRIDPTRISLLIVLVLASIFGIMSVGVILTAVGERSTLETTLLVTLSVIAVVLSWLLLHTAFGQYYARIFYDESEIPGGGRCGGLAFPGTENPSYDDFLYVSFAVGITYAMSDVSATSASQRRTVLLHSIISFFFYSTVLGAVLNAIGTHGGCDGARQER